MTDAEILELFGARSENAIRETEKKYAGYCRSVSYGILGSREDAEECVNDTLLRAWNSIPPSKSDNLRVYLGRIARNLSIDRYRSADDEAEQRNEAGHGRDCNADDGAGRYTDPDNEACVYADTYDGARIYTDAYAERSGTDTHDVISGIHTDSDDGPAADTYSGSGRGRTASVSCMEQSGLGRTSAPFPESAGEGVLQIPVTRSAR